MRTALVTLSLLASSPALAGGVAPIFTGGFHTERLFFYSTEQDGGAGNPIRDPVNYELYSRTQTLGNIGSGLEVVLGDRDDMIHGVFRGYWMMDTPQLDPAKTGLVDADALLVNYRENPRHVGVGTVGIQWGVFKLQEKFRLGISAHAGSGFLTTDQTGFLLAQTGINMNYRVARPLELFLDVNYGLRVRRDISHGLYTTIGLRALFD